MSPLEGGIQMIAETAKAPPSLAALSEARQLLEMLGNDKALRKRLRELESQAAEYRAARDDADKAIAATQASKSESSRALDEIAEAKVAVEEEKKALMIRAEALREREQELKVREEALRPKWEALRKEALVLQRRASEMAASAIAFAQDLES